MSVSLVELLSPATLSRIENYALLAKVAVEGYMSGLHRSFTRGQGSEFLQYRDYAPGDDLKYVDWKVYSRSDRYYTKVFQEETNMNCFLVLDASASLDYQGERADCGKWRYACMVAACLAYLASRQGDNVGLCIYNDDVVEMIDARQRQGQLPRILSALARHKPAGAARHEYAWNYLMGHLRSRGMVVFLSDFLEAEETLPPILKRIRYARHECVAVQVLDPDERDLPFDRSTEFIEPEEGGRILTNPETIRTQYMEKMNDFQQRLSVGLTRSQVEFLSLLSSDSLARSLSAYLHKREALR